VVSRNPDYAAPGAVWAGSLEEAVQEAGGGESFVIGGAELYRQALPLADRLYLTEIEAEFSGDVLFPEIHPDEWREVSRSRTFEEAGLAYAFVVRQRLPSA
jgi:dihydrofolate reductase